MEGLELNEEESVREGGQEAEDGFDEAVESQKEKLAPGETNLQTPTELAGGATGEGQGLHSGGPAEV